MTRCGSGEHKRRGVAHAARSTGDESGFVGKLGHDGGLVLALPGAAVRHRFSDMHMRCRCAESQDFVVLELGLCKHGIGLWNSVTCAIHQ
jgi:hypothetical protein